MLALAADKVLARDGIVLNPALQGHGRALRLGVLDLLAAEAGRAGDERSS